ncbi:MAG: phosphate regulon sensor histidine kinase PhoR [Gammaproteobacteria bacterium]|nr:phosphate regulon sensor histidine kinase PhoR [Gammaproteobacteria bacterium]MBV9620834.1 phosphate regulon sensor histidine kinase PhoR [Gammaproteobacteria bacterium]
MQPATQAWWFAAVRLLGTVLLGSTVGWLFGNTWGGLACALVLHLAWVLANLFRLEWWLRHRSYADPPDVGGVWGEIIAQIVRLHRRKRFHKQRFVQLMRQLQRSTAALPDGVVILNAQREIVWFNRMAGRLLNLRRVGDLGMRVEHLLRAPEFVRYLAGHDFSNPVTVRTTSGEDGFLSLQVAPYGEGQLLLLVRDVTRQMRLEAVRRDFVANASHELRSPLTVISGYLETLAQEGGLDPELKGPVAEMRRQAERMTTIIRDLLELSRLEETEEIEGGVPVDVAALAALLRKDVLARPVHPHEVRLRIESPLQLVGDEPEIHSAFSNLVDNAAKYTPAEGSIEIRWWADEEGGHFAVTDTGMGIPPEHIPRLTERFYRVDRGRSRATGGSGLGLAIVKHVLQRHGARLEVQSEIDAGSCFVCHFPPQRLVPAQRALTSATG